jgi:MFS family permease
MTDRSRQVLRHLDFRLFLSARFFSVLAGQMQSVAVGWHVYDLTHDPLALGYVGLVTFLPAIGFALVTGHVADRFDRRRVLLVTFACQAAASCALFAITQSHAMSTASKVTAIYGVLFCTGTARAFAGPASQSLLPSLVPVEQFGSAVAWGASVMQGAMIGGPALGGVLYSVGAARGPHVVYGACACSFVVCWLLVVRIAPRAVVRSTREVSWYTLLAGVRYVWRHKVILSAISLDLFAVLLGGAVALMPIFARDILHVGPLGLGALRCAPALGAATMALYFAHQPLGRFAGPKMLLAVAVFGLATVGFGVSTNFWLSLGCLVVLGASDMVSVIVRQTVVQLATPDEMRGRVNAVSLVFIGASNELGEFESGVTAKWLGVVPSVVLGGLGTCLVVLVWTYVFRELRKVDRLEDTLPGHSAA